MLSLLSYGPMKCGLRELHPRPRAWRARILLLDQDRLVQGRSLVGSAFASVTALRPRQVRLESHQHLVVNSHERYFYATYLGEWRHWELHPECDPAEVV